MELMKLSAEQTRKEKHRAADETLHGNAQKGGARHSAMLRVKGAASPGETRDHQNGDAAQIHALRTSQMSGADQKRHSPKS